MYVNFTDEHHHSWKRVPTHPLSPTYFLKTPYIANIGKLESWLKQKVLADQEGNFKYS